MDRWKEILTRKYPLYERRKGVILLKIKSSVFSRSLSLAKLSINASLKYATSKITNSPLDNFIISQAVSVTKEFGELKGSLMKAGQMLSMYGEHFLPPNAIHILKTLLIGAGNFG